MSTEPKEQRDVSPCISVALSVYRRWCYSEINTCPRAFLHIFPSPRYSDTMQKQTPDPEEAAHDHPGLHATNRVCKLYLECKLSKVGGKRDLESALEGERERPRERGAGGEGTDRGWAADTPNEKHACPLPLSYKFHSWDDVQPHDFFSSVD